MSVTRSVSGELLGAVCLIKRQIDLEVSIDLVKTVALVCEIADERHLVFPGEGSKRITRQRQGLLTCFNENPENED